MATTENLQTELREIEAAIASGLPDMPAAQLEVVLAALREKREALLAQLRDAGVVFENISDSQITTGDIAAGDIIKDNTGTVITGDHSQVVEGDQTEVSIGDIRDMSGGSVNIAGGNITRRVSTVGGHYIEGEVRAGGDFVAGDKVGGDKITGDIKTGNITGSTIALGHKSRVTVSQGPEAEALAKAFADIFSRIESRDSSKDAERGTDKAEIKEVVEYIQEEVTKPKGEANEKKVERWLKFLAGIAPDILEVTAKSLVSPALGLGTAIGKIIKRAGASSA